jgi:hypothetical protein
VKELVFNLDGTIDPSQLEGMDAETVSRLTSPEFQSLAKSEIRAQRGIVKTGRRESRQSPIRMMAFRGVNRHERRRRYATMKNETGGQ